MFTKKFYKIVLISLMVIQISVLILPLLIHPFFVIEYLFILFIVLGIIIYYLLRIKAPKKFGLEKSHVTLSLLLGTFFTCVLKDIFNLPIILSAAIIGLMGYYFQKYIVTNLKYNQISNAVYCGAFVGMTEDFILPNMLFVILASLISSITFSIMKFHLVGVGGKFGTIAFIGVSFSYLISLLCH